MEWVVISFSRGFPDPEIKLQSPTLQENSLLSEPPQKPPITSYTSINNIVFFLHESYLYTSFSSLDYQLLSDDNNCVSLISFFPISWNALNIFWIELTI